MCVWRGGLVGLFCFVFCLLVYLVGMAFLFGSLFGLFCFMWPASMNL